MIAPWSDSELCLALLFQETLFLKDQSEPSSFNKNAKIVAWWKGISTEDIIDTKEDLQKYFYAIYRFIARFVDYIEDIAIASCKIEIIGNVAGVIDPLFGKHNFKYCITGPVQME